MSISRVLHGRSLPTVMDSDVLVRDSLDQKCEAAREARTKLLREAEIAVESVLAQPGRKEPGRIIERSGCG